MTASRKENPLLVMLSRLPMTAVISDVATGEILWANPRDLSVVGAASPDQVIGRNLLDFLEPAQHGVALRDVEAVARGESPAPVMYRVRKIDGGHAAVQISSVPMVLDGRPSMLSLVADLTEQEEACRELSESEQRYRQLVEHSPDGIVVVAGGEIVYANPTLLTALGADEPGQLLGRSMYDFIAPDHRAAVRKARKRIMATGEAHPPAPVDLVRIDGTRVPTVALSSVIRWHGEAATQTIMRDLRGAT